MAAAAVAAVPGGVQTAVLPSRTRTRGRGADVTISVT